MQTRNKVGTVLHIIVQLATLESTHCLCLYLEGKGCKAFSRHLKNFLPHRRQRHTKNSLCLWFVNPPLFNLTINHPHITILRPTLPKIASHSAYTKAAVALMHVNRFVQIRAVILSNTVS